MNSKAIVQNPAQSRSPAGNVATSPNSAQPLIIQRQLSVGKEDDEFEKEADATADRVMRMPDTDFVQRKCDRCDEEEKVQRKTATRDTNQFIRAKINSDSAV